MFGLMCRTALTITVILKLHLSVCACVRPSLAEPAPYACGRGSGSLQYMDLYPAPVQGASNQIAAFQRYQGAGSARLRSSGGHIKN